MRKTHRAPFPMLRASCFCFARFNTSPLYYLRAWHCLPSIFDLDKSRRGRNLCRHPWQFILSLFQNQIFLWCQSNHYHSIHWVCRIKMAVWNLSDSSKSRDDQQIKGIWRCQQSRLLFPNLSRKDPASRIIHDLFFMYSMRYLALLLCLVNDIKLDTQGKNLYVPPPLT